MQVARLTAEQRATIFRLKEEGVKVARIARTIGFSRRTVHHALNQGPDYVPHDPRDCKREDGLSKHGKRIGRPPGQNYRPARQTKDQILEEIQIMTANEMNREQPKMRPNGKNLTAEEIAALEPQVADLAYRGASNRRIASLLSIDEHTIGNRFHHLLEHHRARRRQELLDAQTRKAMMGDVTMLIWLGKNELEQTDRLKNEHEGELRIEVVYTDEAPVVGADGDGKTTIEVIGVNPYGGPRGEEPKSAPQFPIPHDVAPIVSHEDQRLKKNGLSAVEEQQIKEYRDSRTVLKRAYPNNSRWN